MNLSLVSMKDKFTSILKTFTSNVPANMFGGKALIEGLPYAEIFTPLGKPKKFNPFTAIDMYKSWCYNAANLNAVAMSAAPLRLFSVRRKGEGMPKTAPFRRLEKYAQKQVMQKQKITGDDNTEVVEITEHPFLELLKKVNSFRNGFDHMEETSLFQDCTGNAYWYVERNQAGLLQGTPTAVWILPSNYVSIVPDPEKYIAGYIYGVYGRKLAFDETEIIHFRRPNLKDQFYGMGRIEGVYTETLSCEAWNNFEYSQADNRGIQDLLFKYNKGTLDKNQRRDLMAEFRNALMRQKKEPTPLIADENFSVEKISWSPREMLALSQREWTKETIVNAFGQTLGLYSRDAARANIEGALYKWMRFEIDPSLTRFSQKLNEKLLPMYGENQNIFCQFDTQAQSDVTLNIAQETADRAGKIRSVNEIRQGRNLAKLDDPRADDPFFDSAPAPAPFSSGRTGEFEEMSHRRKKINGVLIHPSLENTPVTVIDYP